MLISNQNFRFVDIFSPNVAGSSNANRMICHRFECKYPSQQLVSFNYFYGLVNKLIKELKLVSNMELYQDIFYFAIEKSKKGNAEAIQVIIRKENIEDIMSIHDEIVECIYVSISSTRDQIAKPSYAWEYFTLIRKIILDGFYPYTIIFHDIGIHPYTRQEKLIPLIGLPSVPSEREGLLAYEYGVNGAKFAVDEETQDNNASMETRTNGTSSNATTNASLINHLDYDFLYSDEMNNTNPIGILSENQGNPETSNNIDIQLFEDLPYSYSKVLTIYDRNMKLFTSVLKSINDIPKIFIIIPERFFHSLQSTEFDSNDLVQSNGNDYFDSFQKNYRLFFFCNYTKHISLSGEDGYGYRIECSMKWIKKSSKFIKNGFECIQSMGGFDQCGFQYLFPQILNQFQLIPIDNVMEELNVMMNEYYQEKYDLMMIRMRRGIYCSKDRHVSHESNPFYDSFHRNKPSHGSTSSLGLLYQSHDPSHDPSRDPSHEASHDDIKQPAFGIELNLSPSSMDDMELSNEEYEIFNNLLNKTKIDLNQTYETILGFFRKYDPGMNYIGLQYEIIDPKLDLLSTWIWPNDMIKAKYKSQSEDSVIASNEIIFEDIKKYFKQQRIQQKLIHQATQQNRDLNNSQSLDTSHHSKYEEVSLHDKMSFIHTLYFPISKTSDRIDSSQGADCVINISNLAIRHAKSRSYAYESFNPFITIQIFYKNISTAIYQTPTVRTQRSGDALWPSIVLRYETNSDALNDMSLHINMYSTQSIHESKLKGSFTLTLSELSNQSIEQWFPFQKPMNVSGTGFTNEKRSEIFCTVSYEHIF